MGKNSNDNPINKPSVNKPSVTKPNSNPKLKPGKTGRFEIPCTEMVPKSFLKNASQSTVFSAITLTDALWKPGDQGVITITFGSYSCDGCSPSASWSQIGNHSNGVVPSMNLGFIDPPYTPFTLNGVTYQAPITATRNYCGTTGQSSCIAGWVPGATPIHEFGHALGMLHEHQNDLYNSDPIVLNVPDVDAYYNCIGMGDSGASTNVLDTYSCTPGQTCNYQGTKFDPLSIMLYYLPSAWIQGCDPYPSLTDCNAILAYSQQCSKNPTRPNFVLSAEDIGWLKQQYPIGVANPPVLTVKFVDPNPEPWKVAWIQKIISETYGVLLGVKFNFETQHILGSSAVTPSPKTGLISNSPFATLTSTLAPSLQGVQIAELPVDENGNVVGTTLKPSQMIPIIVVFTVLAAILIFLMVFYGFPWKRWRG